MSAPEILRAIEAYALMQAAIGELLLENGGFASQHQFDARFGYVPFPGHPDALFFRVDGDSILLAPLRPEIERWIHLARLMVLAGLIVAERRDEGLVYYGMLE